MPGWMGKLLGGVGLSGFVLRNIEGGCKCMSANNAYRSSTPTLGGPNALKSSLSSPLATQGPAIPWRRPNVRHTSNELYVDMVESLSVTIAPSGRLLSALVSGTIALTSKISGVPDLLLSLTTPGGQQAIGKKLELPVFHPCVRLARWRETPGELSFVPPDGRFVLAGYEVDLIPIDPDSDEPPSHMEKVFLPAFVDIEKSLGPTGSEFEVRLTLNTNFPGQSSASRPGAGRSGPSTPSLLGSGISGGGGGGSGTPASPVLDEVVVTVPVPQSVRSLTDMKASRGEAIYNPGSEFLEWRVPTKDAGTVSGTATLRCSVSGYQPMDDYEDGGEEPADADTNLLQGYYDDSASYQTPNAPHTTRKRKTKKKKKVKKSKALAAPSSPSPSQSPSQPETQPSEPTEPAEPSPLKKSTTAQEQQQPPQIFHAPPKKTKPQVNASLMPSSASVSFVVRGWLPSGIKVDSLNIDPRRSRGLGEGVKPYKGVKYLCVSRRGIERRC